MRHGKLVVGICAIAGLFEVVGCRQSEEQGASLEGQNLLLITLDTTRADRIGCYGNEDAVTPALDSLAGRGLLFERTYSQVPMTTPSHCTLFTGRYPREHGVRNNGHTALPDSFPTLATMFKDHDYATGAFVAAFVLDHSFGLARGFDVYNDDMGEQSEGKERMEMQVRGDVVTDRALAWLDTVKDQRFFCWVHYFDPHAPYDPPAEFAATAANNYDGEINYMDSQIKRLFDWLDANGLSSKTLIVAVGDHGEGFGEHGEWGHALFVYQENIHVPLIMAHPNLTPEPQRIPGIVGVTDVFPTLADLFGFQAPEDLHSQSFASLLSGQDTAARASYSESMYGRDQFALAELRSLTLTRWKYISATRPELYDLETDPRERNNVIAAHPDIASDMLALLKERYAQMIPGKAETVALSEAQRRGLESLGYVASTEAPEVDEFLTPGLPDPKDRTDERAKVIKARGLMAKGKHAEAAPILEEVLKTLPNASGVHQFLAICYLKMRRSQDARRELEKTVELAPTNWVALSGLGNVLVALHEWEPAVKALRAAEVLNAEDPQTQVTLGTALKELGDANGAFEHFKRALTIRQPEYAPVYEVAARGLFDRGLQDDALSLYVHAFGQKTDKSRSRYELAEALIRIGKADEAAPYLEEAVSADSKLGAKFLQASQERLKAGAVSDARRYLEVAAKVDELGPAANYALADLAAKEGDTATAVEHYEAVVEVQPANPMAVGALSRIYIEKHDLARAIDVMDRAAEAAPENVLMLISLAHILATAKQPEFRDGARALDLAKRAVELSKRENPAALLTLASALAETGDYAKAISTAQEALGLVRDNHENQALAQAIRTQVAVFEAGRPYRDPRF